MRSSQNVPRRGRAQTLKEKKMFAITNRVRRTATMLPLICAVASLGFASNQQKALAKQDRGRAPLFLTATNGTPNFLAVVNTETREVNYVPTGGSGGAGGNAG